VLDRLPELHPHMKFTLARLCGFPKVQYYASVTPPECSADVLKQFQERTIQFLEQHLDFEIPDQAKHDRFGLGIPDYVRHAKQLYDDSFSFAVHNRQTQQVSLVSSIPATVGPGWTAHLAAQASADWLMYQPRGHDTRMAPQEFQLALAIRCGTVTKYVKQELAVHGLACNCRYKHDTTLDLINHVLVCDQMGFNATQRHTLVKTTIARVLRRHGLAVTIEPRQYCPLYKDGIDHRPDLLVHGMISVATDIVICKQIDDKPGHNAAAAAERKNKTHKQAVATAGHLFFPYAMEAHGFRHASCHAFVRAVASSMTPYEEQELQRDIKLAVAVALARARVNSVKAAAQAYYASYDPEQLEAHQTCREGAGGGVNELMT